MKRIISLFWVVCIALPISADGRESQEGGRPLLTFPAMSDSHVGVSDARFEQDLQRFLTINPNYDVITNSGDLTENGTAAEIASFKRILDANIAPGAVSVLTIGNHETLGGLPLSSFSSLGIDDFVETKEVKGYTFVTYRPSGGNFAGLTPAELKTLEAYIKSSVDKDPSRPVFVITHFPLENTVAGSETRLDPDAYHRRSGDLMAIFDKYPQVILFSGHLHFPFLHPRSIYQTNFTMIGTGSSKQMYSGYSTMNNPAPPSSWRQHYYVEVYEDKVVVYPYELGGTTPEPIGDPYIIDLPKDGSAINPANFRYTPAKRDMAAPSFPAGADEDNYSIPSKTSTTASIEFNSATDDTKLVAYRYTLNGGAPKYIDLPFWESPTPTRRLNLSGLPVNTVSTVIITPIDAYEKEGAPLTVMIEPVRVRTVTFSVVNGNGSLTATVDGRTITSGSQIEEGKSVVFTATPNSGYRIKTWKLNGDEIANHTANSYTLENISAVVSIILVEFETVTSSGELSQPNPLHAWIQDGLLRVTGLTPGETLSVYTITGVPEYRSIAVSNEKNIKLKAPGVYIVHSESNSIKVTFE